MKNFRLILFQFYKPLFLWNIIFSLVGIFDLYINDIGQLAATFFIKFTGYASCIFFQNYFSNKTYYYYRNTGFAVRSLYIYVFLFDFFIYLIMVVLYFIYLFCCHVKS